MDNLQFLLGYLFWESIWEDIEDKRERRRETEKVVNSGEADGPWLLEGITEPTDLYAELMVILRPVGASMASDGRIEMNVNICVKNEAEGRKWKRTFVSISNALKALRASAVSARKNVDATLREAIAKLPRGHSAATRVRTPARELLKMYDGVVTNIDICIDKFARMIATIEKHEHEGRD